MERESFESDDIAAIMNEHLICIKVDREERPDIDQIYMEAVQAMGIHGGWPLNVFLTPDQHPFYGGTYFPPQNWAQLVVQIGKTYKLKRNEISQSGQQLAQHLNVSDLQRFAKQEGPFEKEDFNTMFQSLSNKYDKTYGGLDRAPKFVMPTLWMWLLRYSHVTGNQQSLEMVIHTLRNLAMGGIYDQIGGGFARYSVDEKWFAPHFEKMLYDNAQLVSLYAQAFKATSHPEFKNVVYETINWLQREMTHPEGGFYSALDADSEGKEGQYYTWTETDLKNILGDELNSIADLFHITNDGNWEDGRNILYRNSLDPLNAKAFHAMEQLLKARKKRIAPSLDDKILTGWNAMMIQGLIDAYDAFGDASFLDLARKNMIFIENNLISNDICYRTFKFRKNETEGFLEDYAFLIRAYLALYHATFEEEWLAKARRWCEYVENHFWDETEGYYYFTSSNSEKLIARKKEIFDNVIPSSNSVMARNLFYLGKLFDRADWQNKAVRMVSSLKGLLNIETSNTSHWAILALEASFPLAEIAFVGKDARVFRNEFAKLDFPQSLLLGTRDSSELPLLKDKISPSNTSIFVCYNKTCKLPVQSVSAALSLIE